MDDSGKVIFIANVLNRSSYLRRIKAPKPHDLRIVISICFFFFFFSFFFSSWIIPKRSAASGDENVPRKCCSGPNERAFPAFFRALASTCSRSFLATGGRETLRSSFENACNSCNSGIIFCFGFFFCFIFQMAAWANVLSSDTKFIYPLKKGSHCLK